MDKKTTDVTYAVRKFYEDNPFPNYSDLDDVSSLIERAKKGLFAKLLNEQIPFGAKILEVGCGTGQLSIFLSIANRKVFGADFCFNSLKLGQEFKETNKLENVYFLQMNLFQPAFKPKSFDLVICNGVLHHTADPLTGFKQIARLVKTNGYILIGLYHKYGRILTDIHRAMFKICGDRFDLLDERLKDTSGIKREVWFKDQYKNPHESKHTIREVQGWFRQLGFKFIKSIPKTRFFEGFSQNEKLFKAERLVGSIETFLSEAGMIFTNNRNGGLFFVIGKKEE